VGFLPAGYTEWPAPAALRPAVVCLWSAQVTHGRADRETVVLPDACSDLIWQQGRGAFVAGPDTGPAPARMLAGTVVFGIRFRPAAGGPVLGIPLDELRDQRIDVADLGKDLPERLTGTLEPELAVRLMLETAAGLVADQAPDDAVASAATLLRDPRARVEDVAAEVGLSMRQLRRRCQAAAGYGPKTLQRILRFHRFVRQMDGGAADLAAVAADVGYADQAHLTRECARLAGVTPATLVKARDAG
jgi:AraC-like DNA-binding protein